MLALLVNSGWRVTIYTLTLFLWLGKVWRPHYETANPIHSFSSGSVFPDIQAFKYKPAVRFEWLGFCLTHVQSTFPKWKEGLFSNVTVMEKHIFVF